MSRLFIVASALLCVACGASNKTESSEDTRQGTTEEPSNNVVQEAQIKTPETADTASVVEASTDEAKQVAKAEPRCINCIEPDKDKTGLIAIAIKELKRFGVETTGPVERIEDTLPSERGARWDVLAETCKKGGYDLSPQMGRKILILRFTSKELRSGEPTSVFAIIADKNVVCTYKALGEKSTVAPGLFSIKEKLSRP